jgi:hypothetical protein
MTIYNKSLAEPEGIREGSCAPTAHGRGPMGPHVGEPMSPEGAERVPYPYTELTN